MEKEVHKYSCESCGKVFDYKSLYFKHIDKKIPCNEGEKILKNKEKRTCMHCNKVFTRLDSLKDHLTICKSKMIIDKEIEFDNKDNEIKKELDIIKQQISKITEEKDTTINELKQIIKKLQVKSTYSVSNKDNINTDNIQQINKNNIKILPFGKEDLSYITDDDYRILLNKGFNSIHYFIEYVHFNINKPENQNIYISNMRDKYILIFDGEKWVLKERDDVLQEIIQIKTDILNQKFIELIKTLDENTKYKFKCYLEKIYDNDIIEHIMNDLKLMLYNKKLISDPPKLSHW